MQAKERTVVLNEAQQQVVNELDRNIVLLASAGTGKTNTLSYRVAHIIQSERAKAGEILCLTFTNKACREMKERVISIGGDEAQAVKVATFHSFCYTILKEEAKLQEDLFREFLIIDEEDAAALIRDAWSPLVTQYYEETKRKVKLDTRTMQPIINMVKEHRSVYGCYSSDLRDDYQEILRRMQADKALWKSIKWDRTDTYGGEKFFIAKGVDLLLAYDKKLRELNGLDFVDLITRVHQIFQQYPDTAKRWRNKYSYIAVDEMQDTSELEYDILNTIWKGNHILLCGDYFQTIYEWRGSNPMKLLERFGQDYDPIGIVFNENYRSNQTLFKASFAVLQDMFPELVQKLYQEEPRSVSKADGEPIKLYAAYGGQEEAEYIYREIQRIRSEDETASIAVLVRANFQAKYLSEDLKRLNTRVPRDKQVEFILVDDFKFFRRKEVKDVLAFFKCLVNPWDVMSAKRIIKHFIRGVGEAKVKELDSTEVRKTGLRLTDFLSMKIFEQEPYEQLQQGLAAKDVVVFDVETTGTDIMTARIVQMAAIRIDEEGNEIGKFEEFINPGVPVGDSENTHHFSDTYLQEHGRDATTVLEEFRQFAEGSIIVGHNVLAYDMPLLEQECSRHQVKMPKVQAVYDTLDIYRRYYPNLKNHKLSTLSAKYAKGFESTHNALDDIRATGKILIHAMKEDILPTKRHRMAFINKYRSHFAETASKLDTLRSQLASKKPTEVYSDVMRKLGVLKAYPGTDTKEGQQSMKHFNVLYDIMEEVQTEHPEYVGRDGVNAILELSALHSGDGLFRLKSETGIPIITVHQAKGSEFDYVFIASAQEGGFPIRYAIETDNLEEEQRVFYVALTRAKEHLTITYTSGRGQKPSRFLSSIPKEYIRRIR